MLRGLARLLLAYCENADGQGPSNVSKVSLIHEEREWLNTVDSIPESIYN